MGGIHFGINDLQQEMFIQCSFGNKKLQLLFLCEPLLYYRTTFSNILATPVYSDIDIANFLLLVV